MNSGVSVLFLAHVQGFAPSVSWLKLFCLNSRLERSCDNTLKVKVKRVWPDGSVSKRPYRFFLFTNVVIFWVGNPKDPTTAMTKAVCYNPLNLQDVRSTPQTLDYCLEWSAKKINKANFIHNNITKNKVREKLTKAQTGSLKTVKYSWKKYRRCKWVEWYLFSWGWNLLWRCQHCS